ncbi:peptide chain release factor N(5)-glutamine methyltransferase [Paraconexibacter antarcticus]|uniref:Release factor glutamine methyltransferase n=1 Tax=Paraconexibacter antarcticus TaxID=2949664 RepID=A0ABY5DYC7_9ACTN|nr:peptide chain release factor N(5)-glutamine methyltransferase [Paraconexibacter antarcticus]UTI65827.1 peptide chain release factor N(5)-glutamine methyltransferase [Paraconexibacter antarcticus]
MAPTGVPVRDALDSALVALRAAKVGTPRLDAEVLLAHALGVDRTQLFLEPDAPVTGAAVHTFREAVRRRSVLREPVAYITGTKGFRRLDLHVDGRVLIPRPETEHLVEAAIEQLPRGARVLDVGTGSGAVALALKDERPDLDVHASDVSEDALHVAYANAQRLGLDVTFHLSDLLARTPEVDAVVSNPPYVEDGARLEPEIARHEPPGALFAGMDGLDVVRRLIPAAAAAGARWIALEIGQGQAAAVCALAPGGWVTGTVPDLAGVERIVTLREL